MYIHCTCTMSCKSCTRIHRHSHNGLELHITYTIPTHTHTHTHTPTHHPQNLSPVVSLTTEGSTEAMADDKTTCDYNIHVYNGTVIHLYIYISGLIKKDKCTCDYVNTNTGSLFFLVFLVN